MSGEHFNQPIKCPECHKLVDESFGVIHDDKHDESIDVLIGYECTHCGIKWDVNWEVVEEKEPISDEDAREDAGCEKYHAMKNGDYDEKI